MTTRTRIATGVCLLTLLATATACSSAAPRATAGHSKAAVSSAPASAPVSTPASALPSPDPSDYLLAIRLTAKLPGNGSGQLNQSTPSDAALLTLGGHICAELRAHVAPVAVEKELEGSWTRANSLMLLGAASGQFSSLCPDQHEVVQAYVQSLM